MNCRTVILRDRSHELEECIAEIRMNPSPHNDALKSLLSATQRELSRSGNTCNLTNSYSIVTSKKIFFIHPHLHNFGSAITNYKMHCCAICA